MSNTSDDVAPMKIWEAHKCIIREEFIKWGARSKCERTADITKLANKLATLVMQHKKSLATKTSKELLETRKLLQQTLDSKAKHILFLRKFLAQALKDTQIASNKIFHRAHS